MAYLWTKSKTIGNRDKSISPYLKTWIAQGGTTVCGVTGEGTSKEIQANWTSPFEGESAGAKFEKIGGLIQSASDRTSITAIQSRQIWGGNGPTQFNVVLRLYALSDPQAEVMDALRELEKMIAPQVNNLSPVDLGSGDGQSLGRVPGTITINVGRNAIYPDCVLESISQPLDTAVDRSGLFIRCDVNLSIQTMQLQNKSDIASRYG